MLAGLLENGPSIGKVADILEACKKIMPGSRVETPDAQLQLELERLALSAPHMLADIGFERDPRACSSEKTVWRRGKYCVIISSTPHAAATST
jgi:hypothetical protein